MQTERAALSQLRAIKLNCSKRWDADDEDTTLELLLEFMGQSHLTIGISNLQLTISSIKIESKVHQNLHSMKQLHTEESPR